MPIKSAVEMAIAAVEHSPHPNPLDMDTRDVGESRTDLDLPVGRPRKKTGTVPTRVADSGDKDAVK